MSIELVIEGYNGCTCKASDTFVLPQEIEDFYLKLKADECIDEISSMLRVGLTSNFCEA